MGSGECRVQLGRGPKFAYGVIGSAGEAIECAEVVVGDRLIRIQA